jgi:ABC-type glycerol-3-phosphate transport system substrate-binding protein
VTLRVACPQAADRGPSPKDLPTPTGDDPAAVVEAYGQAWAARRGATLQVVRYDPRTGPPADADVWVLAPSQVPHHAAAGRLLTVPATFTGDFTPYAWTDLLPQYREQLLVWDRAARAVPLLGEAPLCCYRADLLADPAHRAAFKQRFGRDLDAPATWEQFAQIAEFFNDRVPGGHSLPPLPQDDWALDREFYTVAASHARRFAPTEEAGPDPNREGEKARADYLNEIFSFHYDVRAGRPRIAHPGFVYSLELFKRLQAYRPAAAAVPERAFQEGRAVLCVTDAPWLWAFQQTPALRDKVGVCRVPGGDRWFMFGSGQESREHVPNRVPYLGGVGWLAVVPRGAVRPDTAFDLLAELSEPATSGQVALAPR